MSSIAWMLALALTGPQANDAATVIVVVGAAGTSEYGRQFSQWADRWQQAAEQGGARFIAVGRDTSHGIPDRQRLRDVLEAEQNAAASELWVILIGHGTFDGRTAKFNLRGLDVSATELSGWLAAIDRPTAVVNCASASGPFLHKLSADGRVVVTAAKSGYEQNFARFGDYLSQAVASPSADLDKDGQTSLLESFLTASRRTQEFYDTEGRLATEHSLLDDNGDGLGTRPDSFRGIRPVRASAAGAALDGYRAHQFHLVRSPCEQQMPPETRRQRDALELAVIRLRERKAELAEDDYYHQLESVLLDLAKLYEQQKEMTNVE